MFPAGQKDVAINFNSTGIQVRGGFKSLTAAELNVLAGLTYGMGVTYRKTQVDFAFQPVAHLGQVFRIGLGFRF